jgi:hypothetical protein
MSAHVEWYSAERAVVLYRTAGTTWNGALPTDDEWAEEDAVPAGHVALVLDCSPENVDVLVGTREQLLTLAGAIVEELGGLRMPDYDDREADDVRRGELAARDLARINPDLVNRWGVLQRRRSASPPSSAGHPDRDNDDLPATRPPQGFRSCEADQPVRHLQCWGDEDHHGPHWIGSEDADQWCLDCGRPLTEPGAPGICAAAHRPLGEVTRAGVTGARLTMATINDALRGSYTDAGILAWWNRPRSSLADRTPIQAWEAGEHDAVRALADSLPGEAPS